MPTYQRNRNKNPQIPFRCGRHFSYPSGARWLVLPVSFEATAAVCKHSVNFRSKKFQQQPTLLDATVYFFKLHPARNPSSDLTGSFRLSRGHRISVSWISIDENGLAFGNSVRINSAARKNTKKLARRMRVVKKHKQNILLTVWRCHGRISQGIEIGWE